MLTNRRFVGLDDYYAVSDFLETLFQPGNRDGNWIRPLWSYMHSHPMLDWGMLGRIRLWEDEGRLVAVAHYESVLGEAFFDVHPDYDRLKPEMLDYACADLARVEPDGQRALTAYISEFDTAFAQHAAARGFQRNPNADRTMMMLETPEGFAPDLKIRDGFRITSLAEENDLVKMDRVLWRGFNHPGEPPVMGVRDRRQMQSSPYFRHDLTLAAVAPNGDFVSFCGMWYEPRNRIALVEPVATDPDYRRLGLGRAVVLEGVRRCAALGARVAFVGSVQEFYRSLGFNPVMAQQAWTWAKAAG